MKKFYTILFYILTISGLQAQLETAHWRFGFFGGLDFTSGSASTTTGNLHTNEGCASISDNCGNLLFYTDGKTVISKDNSGMQNGNALLGDASSTQSAIIIPNPDDPNIYYIFTTYSLNGVHYSVVDMSLNGGLGAVIQGQKNIQLPLNGAMKGSEKLTAVAKADNSGYWVITHYLDSYYAFSVTAQGVNTTPVVSQVGVNVPDKINDKFFYTYAIGQLKVSPDGNKIAAAHFTAVKEEDFDLFPINYFTPSCTMAFTYGGVLGLYDFDNETGIVSNETILNSLSTERRTYYGVEFSPDGKVLYSSYDVYNFADECGDDIIAHRTNAVVDKYDLTATSIPASQNILFQNNDPTKSLAGSLQLALDGRIYHAMYSSLSYITDPNNYAASIFYLSGIPLHQTTLGLPPFIASLFDPKILINGEFHTDKFCLGTEMEFSYEGCQETIISWDFGDGNTSTQTHPSHTYVNSGTYTLTLTITAPGGQMETKTRQIEIVPPPDVQNAELKECLDLNGEDVEFDLTESYPLINPNGEILTFSFHLTELQAENDENPQPLSFSISSPTILWVRAENEWGCYTIVELELLFHESPEFTIEFPEVEICMNNSAELSIETEATNTVNWYDSQTATESIFTGNPFITPNLTTTTSYWVEVESEEGCPSERIELIVEVTDEIIPEFEPIEPICYGDTFTLPTESNNGITGSWTPAINNEETTIYTFTPEDGQCSAEYEMTVEIVPIPELNLPEIPDICFGETVTIAVATTGEIVNWYESEFDTEPFHTGETYTTPPLSNSLTLWLEAIDGNCTSTREPITITVNELPAIEAEIPDPVCVGNTVELSVITNGNTVNWYESETSTTPIFTGNPFITPPLNNSTTYYVEAVSDENCKSERIPIEAVITEEIIPEFNQIEPVCFGETFTLPTVSNNGITGIWMPEINNTETTTYTFIPNEGQCSAENVTMTVEIVPIPELQLPEVDFEGCIGESLSLTITATGETVNWYENEFDTEPFHTGETYTTLPLSSSLTLWLEAQTGNCRSERQPITIIAHPIPEMEDLDDIIICDGDSYEFTAPQGFDYYQWSDPNGNIISTEAIVTLTTSGSYQLMAGYEDNPCPVYRNLTVSFSQTPTITEIKSTENTLTVYANGIGPFEYSLDNVFWQSSNIFYNLEPGIYFVYVRDLHGCGTSARQGAIMGVPNFISPNGDGKNDAWQIKALEAYPNTRLQVFDRYGKQFLDRILNSDFEWDGRYNGQPLPSGSYWYIITLESGEKLSGHISIRN